MQRGEFSSRFAFIMAASGSAVGLGNIWGFPTNAAENGGGAFLLLYFILAFVLAYPALMAELVIGRNTRANMVTALGKLGGDTGVGKLGSGAGLFALVVASLILSFYGIVAGWMTAYLVAPAAEITGADSAASWLTTQTVTRDLIFTAVFMLLTIMVIAAGVANGIEKWSRRLMPSLLILMLVLVIYVMFQPGALEGLKVYLMPDFSRISDPDLIISAMGQAFFSLSLGVGTMLIYGSYMSEKENLPSIGVLVTLVDTGIAFFAGLLVIPAIFAAQHLGLQVMDASGAMIAGPDLIFQVLPALFDNMGSWGVYVALAFFLLMTIAALTSSISMLEVPVAYLVETFNLERHRATYFMGGLIYLVSVVIIFNFGTLFGAVVSFTTEYSQPLLGIVTCVFAGWVMKRNALLQEIKNGMPDAENSLFWKIWPHYVRFVCPLLILLAFVQSIR